MIWVRSRAGMPAVRFTGAPIDLAAEARKSRRRLYRVSIVYSSYALAAVDLAWRSAGPGRTLALSVTGLAFWTAAEYLVRRYILHGRFPDGPGFLRHRLHRAFDNLHVEHHARPWEGDHLKGTLKDTWPYVALLAALSFLVALPAAPALAASFALAYVVEEWTHHAVHFVSVYGLTGPYWRYITRHHHQYHLSPRGTELAFGLTSGFWDVACGTRIPARDRLLLYGRR